MQGKVDATAKRFIRSRTLLEYRRLNWRVETMARLSHEFAAFTAAARAADFPIHTSVGVHDVPNAGMVTLSFGAMATNAFQRQYRSAFDEEPFVDQQVLEDGGQLVASQSHDGYVFFISNPRKSEWAKPTNDAYIIAGPLDPAEVRQPLIRKMIRRHLIVVRMGSFFGGSGSLTLGERCMFWWIVLIELRKRYNLYRSLITLTNEWGKAIVAAVLATVLSLIAASLATSGNQKMAEQKVGVVSA